MSLPPPPAEDLQSALARVVAPSEAAPEGVAGAVASYAAAVAGPDDAPPVRDYRPREVAVVFGVCAALLLAFDSEGLMTWAQRMDLGPVQDAWRAGLGPVHSAMDRVGFTAPRRWLAGSAESVSRQLGGGEDPLLAQGWDPPASAEPDAAPPLVEAEPLEAEPREAEPARLEPVVENQPAAPIAVLLMGDSMIAGSLGAALTRALARDKRLRVVPAFQTATGLARPDVYDWMKVVPTLIDRERPGLVVCSLGANDPTRLGLGEGEQPLDFGEPGWRTAYAARVVELMRALTAKGARVLWLGLPPMRSGRFSSHAQYLNAIYLQAAKKVRGVEFLELRMLVSDPSGEYATFVRGADGRLVRFRLDDGVHYSPAGARAITRWVVDWVYERYRTLPR